MGIYFAGFPPIWLACQAGSGRRLIAKAPGFAKAFAGRWRTV
jgi:hypothetical protein